jgi:hypothetical protein
MKLAQASAGDPVSALALVGLSKNAPILQDAEFYIKPGAADNVKHAREGAAKTKITRSLNEDNTATPPTPVYNAATKKIVSFDAKVDVVLEDRNEDPEAELAVQTRLEAEEASWELQEMFFEGDTGADAEDFDGMRNLVQTGQVLTTATNGIQVPVGGDAQKSAQQTAVETLLQHAARVRGGATHMYMNENLKIRFVTVAKHLGYYSMSIDKFGKMIESIGNIIVRGAGYAKAGTTLLPFNETVGSSSDCSSIFFTRWGERVDLTVLTSVGVRGRYAGQIGNYIINNVNLEAVLHLQADTALWQSEGWRL